MSAIRFEPLLFPYVFSVVISTAIVIIRVTDYIIFWLVWLFFILVYNF